MVMVDQTGERHFAYYGKANDSFGIQDINFDLLTDTKWFIWEVLWPYKP